MIHHMKLNTEAFRAIAAGYKSIELRLYDEKRQQVQIGDTIEFTCLHPEETAQPCEPLTKKVKGLHRFDSFAALYQKLPLLRCGYTPFTLREASPSDMDTYYTKEAQEKYGVLGIELEEKPLQRFLAGQTGVMKDCSDYHTALREIRAGLKTTHWIWYVFPQIKGLTDDTVTDYFALKGRAEAAEYYAHPILHKRLLEITAALLELDADDPVAVFGRTDAFKLRACMTLFSAIADDTQIFSEVLEKYCMGSRDDNTLYLLR